MKILYLSRNFLSDSDFPLIKEFQKNNANVDVYILAGNRSTGIFEFDKSYNSYGIKTADSFPELVKLYSQYIELKKIKLVWLPNRKKRPLLYLLIYIYLFIKFSWARYDLMHITWPLGDFAFRILFKLKCKKILTVHDPISHSGDEKDEPIRKLAFQKCDYFLLLSDCLLNEFCEKYQIDSNRVFVSHMGEFDYLRYIDQPNITPQKPYVLFLGQIAPHKGVEILLEAMIKVHEVCPNLKLIIAGKGQLYFDYSKYEKLPYIEARFKFIRMSEMVTLFKNCEFTICPYKDATQSGIVQTAFSLNTPIIGTKVGALPHSIIDNVTGYIVPPKNSDALADAIIRLYTNPQKIDDMRTNITEIWQKQMSWDCIYQDYIGFYEKIYSSYKP